MLGLRQKTRLYNTVEFLSFVGDICYALALLHCGVGLSESILMVWEPVFWVQVFTSLFFSKIFLVLLKLSAIS